MTALTAAGELRALLDDVRSRTDDAENVIARQVGKSVVVSREVVGVRAVCMVGAATSPLAWSLARLIAAALNAVPELVDAAERPRLERAVGRVLAALAAGDVYAAENALEELDDAELRTVVRTHHEVADCADYCLGRRHG